MKHLTSRDHFEKYEAIVAKKDIEYLKAIINRFASKEAIVAALANGKGHLNEIPLSNWDGAAMNHVGATAWREGKSYKSLAEQVCTLKHIAIYYIAECEPEFRD